MGELLFIGVSTSDSSIMTIFPRWAARLGLDARIRGIDLPVDAAPGLIRAAIANLAQDPAASGALVTTHKAAVYEHARDLFVFLDSWAELCREVSCIISSPDGLYGWAKDPITSRRAYTALLGDDPWTARDGGPDVVCLGAGGAGLALSAAILGKSGQPVRLTLTDTDPLRLSVARSVMDKLTAQADLELLAVTSTGDSDAVVSAAAPGSLIVNATGMGKDRPGSPVSTHVLFPLESTVWDMNYRGGLEFLEIAQRQAAERRLVLADGWRYFLHGWTAVISEVFDTPIDARTFDDLAQIAASLTGRPRYEAASSEANRD